MKKFTIFLLIFLLFVGFSHVNAQSGGGNLHTVTIVGPESGCLGEAIILTAVPSGQHVDYTLQWKRDGQYTGVTGHTYSFIVSEPIGETEFIVEISSEDCEMVPSPVHKFQTLPKPVFSVDNYTICKNGAVEVTANLVNAFGAEVYRYIWYNNAKVAFDTTYVNKRVFLYKEIITSPSTFYVKAEMMNEACNPDFTEFSITEINQLVAVKIIPPISDTICPGSMVYFALGTDANIQNHGTPTISWWINGLEIPGQSLGYLNVPFYTPGTHYVTVRLDYPSGCEYIADTVKIVVLPVPDQVLISGTPLYCGATATINLTALVEPAGTYTLTWFKDDSAAPGTVSGLAYSEIGVANREAAYLYSVKVSNSKGCGLLSDNFPVYVGNLSNIGITADPTTICLGETVKLTANIAPGQNNMVYAWAGPGLVGSGDAPVCYAKPIASGTAT
ncbi:MAG: hypothetical protein LBI45_09015, partial [Bacteroidales bacterium]|nr:hypothetical protein [Bacteroidales bacterium]